jgi:pimeloyl-ACP methyl ester carboxylesterase
MQKYTFQNRENRTIVVVVEESLESRWLAFVMHGLSGFKEQPHILCFAQAFKDRGFTVVRFDTTNTFWESDGRYEEATLTNYANDLEDVIAWASTQSWYREPFVLCGHSLGAISSALYAEKYPERVCGLVPISLLVSGKMSLEWYVQKYQVV